MMDDEHVAAFERFVQKQRPATQPWTPVTDYSFEARKRIEGRQPALILETFKPTRVLDVGCGFGHLVRLLNDLAGHSIAFGADVRDDADYYLDVTQPAPLRGLGGDLVICREVLEHLTVRQMTQAVRTLVRLSTRYIYLTTRFAHRAEHLLSVQDHDDLDPTHITLVTKPFLRMLFVLEGCTSRPDLEAKMDWQHKGRCLVFEVA